MSIFDDVREKLLGAAKSDDKMDQAADQPREDIELAAYVKKQIEESRNQSTRIAHEGIWMTNIAYLLGFDSCYYDPNTRQFRPNGAAGAGQYMRRNRVHSNIILPGAQNRLARMLKVPPRYEVRPNSMSEEDKEAAKLGEEVVGDVWDRQKVNRKRIDLGMWTQQCGHAYVGVCHDDQLGEPLVDPTTGEMMGYQGEVRVDVASAFECFADPLAKTLEEAGWFARAKVRKLDYFRSHYPERGHLVKEEGAWLLSTQYEQRIATLNTTGGSSAPAASEQMKGAAIEISYYEKRSQKHPKGRHVIVANGVMLKNKKLPVGEIPYAKFDDVIVAGKYFSESTITHVRPLQDLYNRNLQKCAQWVDMTLAGKYIAARGHGLAQEAMNNQSGEVVEYDPVPGAKEPHPMQVPTIPEFVYKERSDYKNNAYEIMGLSEVSRGNLPSASIPAQGIQLLLEQDETRMGIETEQHEHSWARIGMLILKYVAEYYTDERTLKLKGESGLNIKKYTGDSLRRNFDVNVVRGSTVPNSKVLHRQEIMNLYTGGLLGNPQDPAVRDKVLGMLQYGDVGEAWEDQRLDKMQIQRDLEMIESDVAPTVDPKDNHVLHMVEKNRYRKSEKFFRLSPVGQQLLQQNIDAHTNILLTQAHPQFAEPPPVPAPPPPGPPMAPPPVA